MSDHHAEQVLRHHLIRKKCNVVPVALFPALSVHLPGQHPALHQLCDDARDAIPGTF